MAKKDPKEYGKKFFEELIDSFPEADRAGVRELLLAKAPEAVLVKTGEHILRQEDYSTSMGEVQTLRGNTETWRTSLANWKAQIQTELDEGAAARERLKAMGERTPTITGDPDPDPAKPAAVDLTGYVKVTDVEAMVAKGVQQATNYATNFGSYIAGLAVKHTQEFGEVLDTTALIAFCRDNNIQLDRGGYDSFVHEKRETKAKSKYDDDIKAAEARGAQRALGEMSSALPFPTTPMIGVDGNQTLSGLGKDATDKAGAVARAVETYHTETRRKLGTAG